MAELRLEAAAAGASGETVADECESLLSHIDGHVTEARIALAKGDSAAARNQFAEIVGWAEAAQEELDMAIAEIATKGMRVPKKGGSRK
jgi:hypothetical protein